MIIQPITFPKKENFSNDLLYFQPQGDLLIHSEDQIIRFTKNSEISFNSYFNSFSLKKWRKYTTLDNLSIRVSFEGNFILTIITRDLKDKLVFEQIQKQVTLSSQEKNQRI